MESQTNPLENGIIHNENRLGRDQFLKSAVKQIGKWSLKSLPFIGIFSAEIAEAQTSTGLTTVGSLQFLLSMAYLQDQFYSPSTPYPFYNNSYAEYAAIQQIQIQEKAQISFLQNAIKGLGGTPNSAPASGYNFAAITSLKDTTGSYPGYSTNYPIFLTVAQLIEDIVNRAYLGQLQNLANNPSLLNQIAGMNSLHARHSAFFRKVRSGSLYSITQDTLSPATPIKPWVTEAASNAAGNPFTINTYSISANTQAYSGEDQTNQAQIELKSIINADLATESFDEPLSYYSASSLLNSFLQPTS